MQVSASVMETSSSKVTVEYHDPSGVFPLVSRGVAARLPLRNLNWQSPSRPLRQIKQLHVEFVPDQYTQTSLRPPIQRFDSNGPASSFEIVRSGRDQRKDGSKERRHQIPGLKTSPYLKLYVLRCDDKDTYKERERNRVREWLRKQVKSEQHGESHSAFEWLVLHVVVPDTVTASEPRWRESQSEPDTLKERKTNNVKFPGKSSKTVFDRLRSDFNESKSGQDRIAQIRLLKSDVPADLLPTPAVAETLVETPQERENAWKDLMDKFKILILAPFDARVRQYEADMAEQESRRSLPGWNFCTFFIHKEGLAKALESIGLVEDALAIYDELSLGLETVVRDLASGHAEGTATTFTSHTDDIETRILSNRKAQANGSTSHEHQKSSVKQEALFDKDYRQYIVRSNISVFDFFCYLFLRQKALILRLANTKAARVELGDLNGNAGEDLVLTSEVCWRASSFVHNNARVLRQDLTASSTTRSPVDIEALVCSWTFAVADLVLSETAAPVLELAESGEKPQLNGTTPGPNRADFGFGMGANPYPTRNSSLATARKSAPELQRPPAVPAEGMMSPPSSSGTDVAPKGAGIPGLPELATYRAELVMLQRKMLEHLAAQSSWRAGWAAMRWQRHDEMHEVDLDEYSAKQEDKPTSESATAPIASSLILPALKSSLSSESAFQDAYERISDRAMRYYALATQNKSVEVIVGDLAMLRYQQGNIEITEEYIRNVLPGYAADGWSSTEAEVLSIYAMCLKQLKRTETYVITLLDLLAKVCGDRMESTLPNVSFDSKTVDDVAVDVSGLLPEIVGCSISIPSEITRVMSNYFRSIVLESEVQHNKDRDGFRLQLRFENVLDDELDLDEVRAKLVSVSEPKQEIWLSSEEPVHIGSGMAGVELRSCANTFGAYYIDQVLLKAGKLCFLHEPQSRSEKPALWHKDEEPSPLELRSHKWPFVFLYPPQHALGIEVSVAKDVRLDKPQGLVFRIDSGWNSVEDFDLSLRPTSAGLRLHLANAKGGTMKGGQLALGSLDQHARATVTVPYTLEQASPELSFRFEMHYHTSLGSFTFQQSVILRHQLPLDVDVHDVFHLDTLFSTFVIRSTERMPLTVTDAELRDSAVYGVESPPTTGMPMIIFDEAPSNLLYKIFRKAQSTVRPSKKDASLAICVRYVASDELILATLTHSFTEYIQASKAQALSRLLIPLFVERCKQLSPEDVETSIILEQVRVPSFEDIGWSEIIKLLPTAVQPQLSETIQEWHAQHVQFSLRNEGAMARACQRSITVPVEIPCIDVLHGVSMTLADGSQPKNCLTVGKPVQAHINIRSTDRWSEACTFAGKKQGAAECAFVLELQAQQDAWMVGGRRRTRFVPKEEEDLQLDVTLVPTKTGLHSLPGVDIQPEPIVDGEGHNSQISRPPVTCETHFTTVQVIQDLRVTRVDISGQLATTGQPPNAASRAISEPG